MMRCPVASAAERDLILHGIFTPMAPEANVVDFNCAYQSTELGTASHPAAEPVCAKLRISTHPAECADALAMIGDCRSPDALPARKSAQIISRQ